MSNSKKQLQREAPNQMVIATTKFQPSVEAHVCRGADSNCLANHGQRVVNVIGAFRGSTLAVLLTHLGSHVLALRQKLVTDWTATKATEASPVDKFLEFLGSLCIPRTNSLN